MCVGGIVEGEVATRCENSSIVVIGKVQFCVLVGLCPRVRGDDKGNFGKWASCSLALPLNDSHGANKQANKGDRKILKSGLLSL